MLSFSNESDNSRKRIKEIKTKPELFNEEISFRGLNINDVTLGYVNVAKTNDNENLSKLFDKENVGVYGPYETDLGLALYRIRDISLENQTTFSEAKDDIRKLLSSEKAKNEMFKLLEDLNNEVAAGQTLEDLASNFSVSIELLEIENDELPDRFKNNPNAKSLFDNASNQITEFIILADNSLLTMKVDQEIKSRELSLIEASKDIDHLSHEKITFLKSQMSVDLLTEDLRKKRSSNQSFWLIGQPDIEIKKEGKHYKVEIKGFDYYNPSKGQIESKGIDGIALWMIDTNYDERSVCPDQFFFPIEDKNDWTKLKRTLKEEIDIEKIDFYQGSVSEPFESGNHKKIAVKIVDNRGIESLIVRELP